MLSLVINLSRESLQKDRCVQSKILDAPSFVYLVETQILALLVVRTG
jgi:hypothetical protein